MTGTIGGPSFTITGPTGNLNGNATAGIRYTDSGGWEPVAGVGWSGGVNPLTADFDTGIEFILDARAFGALGLSLESNLGPRLKTSRFICNYKEPRTVTTGLVQLPDQVVARFALTTYPYSLDRVPQLANQHV